MLNLIRSSCATRTTALRPHHATTTDAGWWDEIAASNAISTAFDSCSRYENECVECIKSIICGDNEWKAKTTSISSVRILFDE